MTIPTTETSGTHIISASGIGANGGTRVLSIAVTVAPVTLPKSGGPAERSAGFGGLLVVVGSLLAFGATRLRRRLQS